MNDASKASSTAPPIKNRAQPTVKSRVAVAIWRHRWFALTVITVIGIAAWQVARFIIGPAVVVDAVARGNLVQTVVASGHVESRFRVEIGSQITGTVADVLVDQGQHVTRGQPLILIDNRELQAGVVQAQGAVAQAEARLRQLRELTLPAAQEAFTQAKATLMNAQQSYNRASDLATKGAATKAALDEAQKNLDVARAVVRAGELQVFTNSPGGSDYVLAETQLSQAKANLDTAQSRLSYTTITAPRDGVLISRNVERGTVVQPGKALLVLAPDSETELVLQIDEKNVGLVAVGQQAVASADAFPDKRFSAQVSYINPGVDITRASVEVKLTVPNPPEYLRQDMTVSVDIEVARSNNTLILPRRDIYDAMNTPWVMVLRDGRARKQSIQIGLAATTHVEIIRGLSQGEEVVPTTAGVKIGRRVRPILP